MAGKAAVPARITGTLVAIVVLGAVIASSPALAISEYVSVGSFGTEGSGNGQLSHPTSLGVNESLVLAAAGDVYVLDQGNNRIEQFDATGVYVSQFTGAETPATTFAAPEGLAIDNSGQTALDDPSVGDVYVADVGNKVVDKFTPEGIYVGQITGTVEGAPLRELHDVTVDAAGNVWVAESEEPFSAARIVEYDDTGSFVRAFDTTQLAGFSQFGEAGLAVDAAGDVYLNTCCEGKVAKFNPITGEEVAHREEGGVTTLAVARATDELFLDQASRVVRLGQFGETAPAEIFPTEGLSGSHGIAVTGPAADVYVSQRESGSVEIFSDLLFPTVTTALPSGLGETKATLRGTVNPEGEEVTECRFEYGTEAGNYNQTAPCSPPAPLSGSSPVVVTANVTGLEPRTTYHYRLTAANGNGTRHGGDETAFTVSGPVIESEAVADVRSGEASVTARINAGGEPTTYQVEYGATTGYGASTPVTSIGAPQNEVSVSTRLGGLQSGTFYHFRFVANNPLGDAEGADTTFSLSPSTSAGLPDDREYELVSGIGTPGEVYAPAGVRGLPAQVSSTEFPFQASAGGDAVVYVGDPGEEGGNGLTGQSLGNEYRAARDAGEGRWDVDVITPQVAGPNESELGTAYEWFSSDLSLGIMSADSSRFAALATPHGPPSCEVLYARTGGGPAMGAFHALFSETQTPGFCGVTSLRHEFTPQNLLFAGASADGGELLFQSPAALVAGSTQAPEEQGNNLYVATGTGVPQAVSVLPNGELEDNATFGGPNPSFSIENQTRSDFSNVIAMDGSRIFWTDLMNGQIYMRINPTEPQSPTSSGGQCIVPADACTVQVSEGNAKFWTATPSGRFVFYTENEQLWKYDTKADTRKKLAGSGLEGESAGVQGIVGVSEDGLSVYFVASGLLAANKNSANEVATARLCEEAEGSGVGEPGYEEAHGRLPAGKGCNLYLSQEEGTSSSMRFIATLAAKDNGLERERSGARVKLGAWQPDLASRTAAVSPDGHALVFESVHHLTGYDSSSLEETEPEPGVHAFLFERGLEVFVYDSGQGAAGQLSCASCSPTGASPTVENPQAAAGSYLPVSLSSTYMRRWISEDGTRVFFDTGQPLVAEDGNHIQDVYEWEREGTPGCPVAPSVTGGCVFLLSGGDSSSISYFIDASATGDDVFLTHRGQLVPGGAPDGKNALYDVRVNGGFPKVPSACAGDSCQSMPPPEPGLPAPATSTFSGVSGNFLPVRPVKPVVVALTRKQKLERALRACRRERSHRRRLKCERQARRQYGSKGRPTARKRPARARAVKPKRRVKS